MDIPAFRRLATSRRAQFAVLGNAAVSLASLGISVAIARPTTVTEFSAFAMAMVVYVFGTGIIRSAFTDTALARADDPAARDRSLRRALTTTVVAALAVLAWGAATSNVYMVILAIAMHGLTALEFSRTYESAVGRAGRSAVYGVVWSGIAIACSAVSLVWTLNAVVVFAIWAGSGAIVGYSAMAIARAPWGLGWPRERTETAAASLFSLDYLVGSGGSALTTALVGMVVNPAIVGALRGAGTLLGPVNLVASTARSLTIPVLARAQNDPRREMRVALQVTGMLVVITAPLLILVTLIPPSWGELLLGDTWSVATLALTPLAVESLFALVGGIPSAGHRAAFAGKRALVLRLSVGIPRPIVVTAGAMLAGVAGAAWAMAGIAVVNAAIWWLSYRNILRRPPSVLERP